MINPTAWPKDLLLSPEFIPIYKAVFCVTILNESSLSKLFSCTLNLNPGILHPQRI